MPYKDPEKAKESRRRSYAKQRQLHKLTDLTENYLKCSHCGAEFLANFNQWKKRFNRDAHCSKICAMAVFQNRNGIIKKDQGPCPVCKKMFQSKTIKKYCSMNCYQQSDEMRERLKQHYSKGWEKNRVSKETNFIDQHCLECGELFKIKPWKRTKFCSHLHYRKYMEKRFDRWFASPQGIALPQGYDEFMLQEELPCLIADCDWRGRHLAAHIQRTHGILSEEFKRAAGFNLTTGLVCPDLHQQLIESNQLRGSLPDELMDLRLRPKRKTKRYVSLESKEHAKKAHLLRKSRSM